MYTILSSSLDIHFEFGLQTIHEKELQVLNRVNDVKLVEKTIKILNKKSISYEFTLLYGIPYQTYTSFKQNIDFLRENDCKNIKAFPLNLLRGTQLWKQRHTWQFKQRNVGRYNIPAVVSCKTFSVKEWKRMHDLAESLHPPKRD